MGRRLGVPSFYLSFISFILRRMRRLDEISFSDGGKMKFPAHVPAERASERASKRAHVKSV